MSNVSISELKAQLDNLVMNPNAIQKVIYDALDNALEGEIDIVDPSNPFVFLLESAAVIAANNLSHAQSITRRIYPSLAVSEDEIYDHMSDADYVGRFALPASATFNLIFNKDEIVNKAIDDEIANYKKVVIPRNTCFTVAGMNFSMEYPIELRVLSSGALQIVYDNRRVSPLTTLENNVVNYQLFGYRDMRYLMVNVPVKQFTLTSHYTTLNDLSPFDQTYTFSDHYYHCRIYTGVSDTNWQEIYTTHSDQIHDPTTATAVLRVVDGSLRVTIPLYYYTANLLGTQLRVDVYTTKGPLEVDLSGYTPTSFSATWEDLDNDDRGKYTSIVPALSYTAISCSGSVSGGRGALDVSQLRDRVIKNANRKTVPITENDLNVFMEDLGYDLVRWQDDVTDRIYLATRALPAPKNTQSITPAGCTVSTWSVDLIDLKNIQTVYAHTERYAVMPSTLFKRDQATATIVSDADRLALEALSAVQLVSELNANAYVYTPYLHILEDNNDIFDYRIYHIDNPVITYREFLGENLNVTYQVSTKQFSIQRKSQGYILRIVTLGGSEYNALDDGRAHLQFSFIPVDEKYRVYRNAQFIGKDVNGNRIFELSIDTQFDIDREHQLRVSGFAATDTDMTYLTTLEIAFELYYVVSDANIALVQTTEIDQHINRQLLPDGCVGISYERVNVQLIDALEAMYNESRSSVSSAIYDRYETNVPAYYERDIYQTDENGHMVFNVTDGKIEYNLLHSAGDPVLDYDGNQVYRHRAGDVKVVDGEPVVISAREMIRFVKLTLIDAKYRYTTEPTMVTYRDNLGDIMAQWIEQDIESSALFLLPRTQLYFMPKTTVGFITISIADNGAIEIPSELSFTVDYYVDNNTYNNADLRNAIIETTQNVVAQAINATYINTSGILALLDEQMGEDVIAIKVHPLGPNKDMDAFRIIGSQDGCSLAKNIQVGADGTLQIRDDITINFYNHTL